MRQQNVLARLAVLAEMGLAQHSGTGNWIVRADLESVLRAMQRTGDRQKTLKAHGALRDCTERPEAVEAGTVKLVGTDPARIAAEAARLLDDDAECRRMSRIHNPYGDCEASRRIARIAAEFLGCGY